MFYSYNMAKKKARKRKSSGTLIMLFSLVLGLSLLFGLKWGIPKMLIGSVPCANSISCISDLSGTYEPGKVSSFMGKTVTAPAFLAQNLTGKPSVLAASASASSKHIYVDLASQKLYAYEGNNLIYSFSVSTGRWHPTPTGDFHIWVKLRYAHMEGGDPADGTYYNLYNIPYTMFFYSDTVGKGQGYSIHGAYWHNNFGHTMSHGCVNMRPEDAAKIYDWATPVTDGTTTYATADDPGTLVTIYGTPPTD